MGISAKEADSVFKIVDNILKQALGEKAALLIYKYMESRYSLRPSELATKFDVFAKGLESFLNSGALIIERKIIEEIYSRGNIVGGIEFGKAAGERDFGSQVRFAMQKTQTVCFYRS